MFFVKLLILTSRGSPEPYEPHHEAIRVDLVQRMRPIVLPNCPDECTELTLDNDEIVYCRGSIHNTLNAFDEAMR